MNKRKIVDLPTRSQSTLSKSVSVDENGIYIQPCEIVTYRSNAVSNGLISVNTGKLASIRGGMQLFRINVYNHNEEPNLIMLSIWTHSTGAGISSKKTISMNSNLNTVSVYEDENKLVCFKINLANISQVIVEDLSPIKYPITFI